MCVYFNDECGDKKKLVDFKHLESSWIKIERSSSIIFFKKINIALMVIIKNSKMVVNYHLWFFFALDELWIIYFYQRKNSFSSSLLLQRVTTFHLKNIKLLHILHSTCDLLSFSFQNRIVVVIRLNYPYFING